MNKLTNPRDEAFAGALFNGINASAAYREVFPVKAAKMSDGAIRVAAHELVKKPAVAQALQQMREEYFDAGGWRKTDSIEVLVGIARSANRNADKVAATKELNAILGFNAPAAISMTTVSRVVVEFVQVAPGQ